MKVKKPIAAFVFLLITAPHSVTAWTTEVDWPTSPTGNVLDSEAGLATLVEYLFEWGVAVAVILLLGSVIYASFLWVVSTGNPAKISKAKSRVRNAFAGTALIFCSWLFLVIINPELAIISDAVMEPGRITQDVDTKEIPREDVCDYGLVTYNDRHQAAIYPETETRITFMPRNEVFARPVNPISTVACERKRDMEKDVNENDRIKFVEARVVSRYRTDFEPICDCANTEGDEGDMACYIDWDDGDLDYQYCYMERDFDVPGGPGLGGPTTMTGAVKFVSQKEIVSDRTTCFAGDERMEDGGGCSLSLYNDEMAGRCADKIAPTSATTTNIEAIGYDKDVSCMEIYGIEPVLPEGMEAYELE